MGIVVIKDKEYYRPTDSINSLREDIGTPRNMLDDTSCGNMYRSDIYDYIKQLEELVFASPVPITENQVKRVI